MSESYRALTRKYRPRNFQDIVSQEHVSNTLVNAIQTNRLAHAYMFCGPRGVGKTTMARVLARTINDIDESVDGEELNSTLNIIEIDAASNNKVEDVHRIRETVRIPPQNGRYKIYIIDEVHMLTKQAFNALLKTLEEPPAHAIFIFATTEPHKVLPTILSRVQRFDFRRITVDEIVLRLKKICADEAITIDDESLHVIAKKADGALRDALSVMDQAIAFCGTTIEHTQLLKALNVVGTETFFQFTSDFVQHDASAAMHRLNELLMEGYDMQEFLIGLTEHFRNLYMAADTKNLFLLEATEDTKKRYQEVARQFTTDDLMRFLHLSSEGQYKVKDAHQPRIQLEICLLKLVNMKRSDELMPLLNELRALKVALQSGDNAVLQEVTKPLASAEPMKEFKLNPPVPAPSATVAPTPAPAPTPIPVASKPPVREPAATPTPAPKPAAPAPSPVAPALPANPFQQSFFGEPAIKRPENAARMALFTPQVEQTDAMKGRVEVQGNLAVATKPELDDRLEELVHLEERASKPIKTIKLDDLLKVWDAISGYFADKNPALSISIKQSTPTDVHDLDATLCVKDAFTHRLIEQNGVDLSRVTGKFLGVRLNYTLELQKQESSPDTYDPYTRFRKLQQNDPVIGTIVEVFGAELDF